MPRPSLHNLPQLFAVQDFNFHQLVGEFFQGHAATQQELDRKSVV